MLKIFRIAIFALITVAVGSCGIGSNVAFRRGAIDHGFFIAPDGAVSALDNFDPVSTFRTEEAHCVLILGEEVAPAPHSRMKIHWLVLHTAYHERGLMRLCHFQNEQRYKGIISTPGEGAYLYTSAGPGIGNLRNDRNRLWPIILPGWSAIVTDPYEHARCVDVRGLLSQQGVFNHLGGSRYAFTITRVYRTWPIPPHAEAPGRPAPLASGEESEAKVLSNLEQWNEYWGRDAELAIAACQNGS